MTRTGPVAARESGGVGIGLLGPLVAALVVALVVVVDVGAWFAAGARAQAAADGAALAAAVAADGDAPGGHDPGAAAADVARRSGGALVLCRCPRGTTPTVEVIVRVPLPGLVLPRIWATHVEATASASSRWQAGQSGTNGP